MTVPEAHMDGNLVALEVQIILITLIDAELGDTLLIAEHGEVVGRLGATVGDNVEQVRERSAR